MNSVIITIKKPIPFHPEYPVGHLVILKETDTFIGNPVKNLIHPNTSQTESEYITVTQKELTNASFRRDTINQQNYNTDFLAKDPIIIPIKKLHEQSTKDLITGGDYHIYTIKTFDNSEIGKIVHGVYRIKEQTETHISLIKHLNAEEALTIHYTEPIPKRIYSNWQILIIDENKYQDIQKVKQTL